MGEPTEDTEYLKLPIEDRCVHKLWKARVSGYEEAAKTFPRWDEDDANWKKFHGIIKKFVIDSNAIAQEKGLEAALAYVENCGQAGKICSDLVEGLVVKCLGAPKAKTKELAKQICLMLCEIEVYEKVIEDLIKGLTQKNPKVVAGCVSTMRECLKAFGAKIIKVSPLLKATMPLLDHRDKGIREEGKQLIIESYRWVGEVMKQQLSGLKPVQITELETEFEKMANEKARPERYLRSQQQVETGGGDDEGSGEVKEGEDAPDDDDEAMDPYDLIDPVDILSKLPKNFYEQVEEKKWQLRKESLDALLPLSQTPKIINGDFGDLTRVLKKFIAKDTNVMLVALAAQCLAGIAKGLRANFKNGAAQLLPVCLEKFKEKKVNVVSALTEAVDALYPCLGIEAIQEDCLAALKHKTPSVNANTGKFLARCFSKCPPLLVNNKKMLQGYTSCLIDRLSHPDVTVRDAASEALGVLIKFLGEPQMTKFMPDLDSIKMGKIKEFADKAELTGKPASAVRAASAKPAPAGNKPAKAKVVKPAAAAVAADDYEEKPKPKPKVVKPTGSSSSAPSAPKAASKLNLKPNSRATSAASSRAKKGEDIDGSPLYTDNNLKQTRFKEEMKFKVLKWNFGTPRPEFVEQLKEQMITANFNKTLMTQMFHNDFKQHLKAIDSLSKHLRNDPEGAIANLDLILKWTTFRFFETNPSVLLKTLEYLRDLFGLLQDNSYSLHDIEAVSFTPYLITKVGDPKDQVRGMIKVILKTLSKVYPASKVSQHLMNGLTSKNAKQRMECLDELGHLVRTFGSSVLQSPSVAANLKDIAKQISDRDNMVRNAALNCMAEVYFQDGEKLYKIISFLPDKDMAMLEERIKRLSKTRPAPNALQGQGQSQPEPVRPEARQQPEVKQEIRQAPPAAQTQQRIPSAPLSRMRPSPSKARPVSGAFTLDFEKIESQVNYDSNLGVRLIKHDLDDILNDEPVRLPSTVTGRKQPVNLSPPGNSNGQSNMHSSPPSNLSDMPEAYEMLDVVLAKIMNQDSNTCINALAQLDELIKDKEKVRLLGDRIDPFLMSCSMQYKHVLQTKLKTDNYNKREIMRILQYLTMGLMSLYHYGDLTVKASTAALHDILNIILLVLLEPVIAEDTSQGNQLVRALNVLTVKIIERSNHTNVTSAFVQLLKGCVGNTSLDAKYLELVMKCIWKIVRQIPKWEETTPNALNMDVLMSDIHDFFKTFPSTYWKKQDTDMPMRTVKTLVHTLVKLYGDSVLDHLGRIQDPENSELQPYLKKLLDSGVGSDCKPTPSSNNTSANKPKPKFSKSDHEALADIFKKIGNKEETKQGLQELYNFKQDNPQADLEPFLAKSSQYFRDYIERGLERIAQDLTNGSAGDDIKYQAQTINSGENSGSGGSSHVSHYMERLRMLRERGGLEPGAKVNY